MRLDKLLTEQAGSRTKAADWIRNGRVTVGGVVVTKAGYDVQDPETVKVARGDDFVSRSGAKLEQAFSEIGFSVEGETVLDIGASTGGFTDVCLRRGAAKVYALDVGHLQLAARLDQDPRVVKMEGMNARDIETGWFSSPIDFVCMDVSFISSRTILESLFAQFVPEHLALLVKPQFECGPQALNKHGVLKNGKLRQKIFGDMQQFLSQYYAHTVLVKDILPGRSGNQEAIIYAGKRRKP